MRTALTLTALLAMTTAALATDCKAITDPAKRLACFDTTPKTVAIKKIDPWASAKVAMGRKLVDPESARWGDFYLADGIICGAVNAKNRMGGYDGMTGFTYEPDHDRAVLLFSGRTDGDAWIATKLYRAHCLSDARADRRIAE